MGFGRVRAGCGIRDGTVVLDVAWCDWCAAALLWVWVALELYVCLFEWFEKCVLGFDACRMVSGASLRACAAYNRRAG